MLCRMSMGKILNAVAGVVVAGAVTVGGVWVYQSATAAVTAQETHLALSSQRSLDMAASSVEDQQVQTQTAVDASAWQTQQDAIAAQKAAAAAARKAAAQKAAQLAAQQAAQQTAQQTTVQDASVTPADMTQPSGEPSGTPLPMVQETDPNNGHYGQMVINVDPGSWCASHSGTTRGGVPECT